MTIRIVRHTQGADYAHYPGQVLVNVAYERELLDSGAAVPVVVEPEQATALKPEIRKRR